MSRRVRLGFTLMESAVALLIVGLTAGAALEANGARMRAVRRSPNLVVAMTLAQDRLAAVRLMEPEQFRRLPDSLARGRFAAPFAEYRWLAAARVAEGDLYDVRVEVTWSDGSIAVESRLYVPFLASTR